VRSPLPSLVTMTEVPGLGDQEVGSGDPDIGREEAVAQHARGLPSAADRLGEIAPRIEMRVHAAEIGLHLRPC
jgi:hypothetical protein